MEAEPAGHTYPAAQGPLHAGSPKPVAHPKRPAGQWRDVPFTQ